jgi:hypothetical protein
MLGKRRTENWRRRWALPDMLREIRDHYRCMSPGLIRIEIESCDSAKD